MNGGLMRSAVVMAVLLGFSCSWAAETEAPDRAALLKQIEKMNADVKPFTELFTKTIEFAMPSVVSITTTRTVRVEPMPDMRFLFPFRDLPFGQPNQPQRPRNFQSRGLGSGFVIDAVKGYVVTNAHVVRDVKAEHINLVFQDGRIVTAEKVLIDPRSDVAVIKIPTENLVALEWANGAKVKSGQWVIAVGSPMGFGGTATVGIISAPSTRHRFFAGGQPGEFRANIDPYAIEDYIQTDAAINPGNSGGPLLQLDGRVIGMNTLIVSSTSSSAGLGFAVPERIIKPAADALINYGKVVRGRLGVGIIEPGRIDDQVAAQFFKMQNADEVFSKFKIKKEDDGVVVTTVVRNSPAEKAGVEVGDLIKSINGIALADVNALRDLVAGTKPGNPVELVISRAGREQKMSVKVDEQPSGESAWAEGPGETSTNEAFGLTVQPLTPELDDALGYPEGTLGLIVTDVDPDGVAAKGGLQRNDAILEVNGLPVASVDDFDAAVGKSGKGNIALLVRRGNSSPRMITLNPKR